MKKNLLILFIFTVFATTLDKAQDIKKLKFNTRDDKTTIINKTESTQSINDKFLIKDGSTTLLEINSEGPAGSIVFPSVGSLLSGSKLYNNGGDLFWGNTQLNVSSGANSIDDLSDAISNNSNVYLGSGTGANNSIGNNNSAVGIDVLNSNTSGSYNIVVGNNAMYLNEKGSFNIAMGNDALKNNLGGSNAVAIGYQSQYFSNNTATVYTNCNTSLGYQSLRGSSTPANNTGNYNSAFGFQSLLFNKTGNDNVAFGYSALFNNTTGDDNTAYGHSASYSNTTGISNTAIGNSALYSNVAGNYGVAVGFESQKYANNNAVAFDNFNVSLGYQSLMGSTTPSNNTGNANSAVGYQTLFSNTSGGQNAGSGSYSLHNNTEGSRNTASGSQALWYNTTGDNNAAIGYNSLYKNTTGSKNTALGSYANVTSGDLTNATAVGYNAQVDASNKIRLGDANVTVIEGNVPYTYPSDSTKKENFLNVEGEKVLKKFVNFRLKSWNYKTGNPLTQRHYGIMAQDFFSAFGHDEIGTIGNDTTLTSSDVSGINMIAVQALEKRTREQEKMIMDLIKQNSKLEKRLNKIESLLEGIKVSQINQ